MKVYALKRNLFTGQFWKSCIISTSSRPTWGNLWCLQKIMQRPTKTLHCKLTTSWIVIIIIITGRGLKNQVKKHTSHSKDSGFLSQSQILGTSRRPVWLRPSEGTPSVQSVTEEEYLGRLRKQNTLRKTATNERHYSDQPQRPTWIQVSQ